MGKKELQVAAIENGTVIDKEKGIVKCHYCDKEQDINNVELV